MDDYCQSMESGLSPVRARYPISASQALEETLFLGLRLTHGVDWQKLLRTYGGNALGRYEDSMRRFSARGWVEWKDSTVRLTPSGMLLSNEIFQEFL